MWAHVDRVVFCNLVGDVAGPVCLHERNQSRHVWDVWVSIHDLLHRALGEEGAQLAPQALPLLDGRALSLATHLGIRETALHPWVIGQTVGVSNGGLPEVRLLWEMTIIVLVMWRQRRARVPCWMVMLRGQPGLLVTAPTLAVCCVLLGEVAPSTRTEPLGVPTVRPREGVVVLAQVAAGHTAAVAVMSAVGYVLDVKPGHWTPHGAKGLIYIWARAVVEACVRLASWAAGVSLAHELLTGWCPVWLVLHAQGWSGGWGASALWLVGMHILQARFGREVFGSVSLRPQLIGHRELWLVGALWMVELALYTIRTLFPWEKEIKGYSWAFKKLSLPVLLKTHFAQ